MNIYVACAERDKSCPHGWRLAIDCVFLGGAEHDKSCPYGSRPALLNLSVFANFTYTTCNFQRKCLYLRRNLI